MRLEPTDASLSARSSRVVMVIHSCLMNYRMRYFLEQAATTADRNSAEQQAPGYCNGPHHCPHACSHFPATVSANDEKRWEVDRRAGKEHRDSSADRSTGGENRQCQGNFKEGAQR